MWVFGLAVAVLAVLTAVSHRLYLIGFATGEKEHA